MQIEAKDLFNRFSEARKKQGKPASTDMFDVMIRQAMGPGGPREAQYEAFLDKLRQVVESEYKTSADRQYNYKNKRMGIDKQGPKGGRPGGIKVGKEGRNAPSEEQKEMMKNIKRNQE